jgi:ribosomal protein S18 acetylase RimI-like enzyme
MAAMDSAIEIRRELRPGDLGEIVRQHGRLYVSEGGLDPQFEVHVAAAVAKAAREGWPERGAVRIVERDGEFAGSLALTDEGGDDAALRWVLIDPAVRGRGLGRRLVGELVAEAESQGFRLVGLETLGILTVAAAIYRDHGFRLVSDRMGPPWGDPDIPYQRYELVLPRGRDREPAETGVRPHLVV